MEVFRAYKVELDPNNKQRTVLVKFAGAARFAWNWGLAERVKEYKETGESSNFIEQSRHFNSLKKVEFPWAYDVSSQCFQEALRDLDEAYKHFFRRVKKGENPGFPKFKSRKKGVNNFRLKGSIYVEVSRIKLPRLPWIRLKERGYIPTRGVHILSVTVSEKAGRWFVSVNCKQEIDVFPATSEPIGVDLGIKDLAVCSDGRRFNNPKPLQKVLRQLARKQRELSRREKGGKNREKSRKKVVKLHYRVANIRKDVLHKVTTAITARSKPSSERPSMVVIEDLNIREMMKDRYLSRIIADASWCELRRQLEYKTIWCGEKLVVADRFFPSSKLCSNCGCINSELTLADRKWTCGCGAVLDRDLNAACNLRDLALKTTGSSPGIDACGENVRPELVQAVSEKQEPSIKPQLGF